MRDGSWSRQRTKKRGPFSNRRSARPCANRRPAESRHHNGSVIIAGARLRHLCACQPFVLHVTVARTAGYGEGALYVAVHPDGAAQGNPVNPATFRHSSHGGTCCSPPSGCQARSRQRRWPEGPGFTARWWGADNRTCDQINPHPTAAPPVLRPSVKFSAVFARILTAANSWCGTVRYGRARWC
jgi:hypothetical protein